MAAIDNVSQQFEGHMPVSDLIPTESWERFPKGGAHDEYQARVQSDIAEHGIQQPLEVYHSNQGQTGEGRRQKPKTYVQNGHHRLMAAKSLGIKTVPVIGHTHYGTDIPEGTTKTDYKTDWNK